MPRILGSGSKHGPVPTSSDRHVPDPVKETFCGLPAALSVMVSAALREPRAAGVKVTLNVQLAPPATLEPQVLVSAKSPLFLPVIATLLRLSGALPILVKVTFWAW